jgi:hypothetical protein
VVVTHPELSKWIVHTPVITGEKVRVAVLPVAERQVVGSATHAYYMFAPWADVDARDLAAILAVTYKSGCACNGSLKEGPMFGTADDILSGKVVPAWKGRYGT